jgi:hypothetical protein
MTTKVAKLQRASLSNPIRLEVNSRLVPYLMTFVYLIMIQALYRHDSVTVLFVHPSCSEGRSHGPSRKLDVSEFNHRFHEDRS